MTNNTTSELNNHFSDVFFPKFWSRGSGIHYFSPEHRVPRQLHFFASWTCLESQKLVQTRRNLFFKITVRHQNQNSGKKRKGLSFLRHFSRKT